MPSLESNEYTLLPKGIRTRRLDGVNGLNMHVLEAGEPDRPTVLLLHGFPELSYSWRNNMLAVAAEGFHVVAPDQRGYGFTTGWDDSYDGDVRSFGVLNLVSDILQLTFALERQSIACVVGHDFGSVIAACCALTRPDVFRSVVMMSSPFCGIPKPPGGSGNMSGVISALAKLDTPRKHYQWYFSTRDANSDITECGQGVQAFLRAYFYYKSADWPSNSPLPLKMLSAAELAQMPEYYIMELDKDMPATVASMMPAPSEIAGCTWLPDEQLAVYAKAFERTGFQGGLNWYRNRTGGQNDVALAIFSGGTIDVPSFYIAGSKDWGTYQVPGCFERMQRDACTRMTGVRLVDNAGHWVQQEQPDEVNRLLTGFLTRNI